MHSASTYWPGLYLEDIRVFHNRTEFASRSRIYTYYKSDAKDALLMKQLTALDMSPAAKLMCLLLHEETNT